MAFLRLFIFLLILNFAIKGQNPDISIVYPKNNSLSYNSNISFKWNNIEGYDSIKFNLSTTHNFTTNNLDTIIYNSNILNLNHLNHSIYYWKIINYFNNDSICSDTFKFQIFNPQTIDSLSLWLSADSNLTFNTDSFIYSWNDLSDSNYIFEQNNNINQPYVTTNEQLNNKNIIHFSGNQFLSGGNILNLGYLSHSFFIFGRTLSSSGYFFAKKATNLGNYYAFGYYANHLYFEYTDENNKTIQIPSTSREFQILSFINDRNILSNSMYVNTYFKKSNTNISNSNYNFNSTTRLLVGAHSNSDDSGTAYRLNGDIAEIIVYNTALNDSLRNLVEQYLRYKYAPPVNLGYDLHLPYGFCDTTLDAGSRFTNYLWSTGDTTQTITVNQAGQYSVTVTDIFGFQSSDSVMVYYPQINQQLSDTIICFGDTIKWNAGLQDTNYTFLWQDNTNDSIMSIFSAGQYYVQITDSFGCSYKSDTIHITIDNYPVTTSLGNDTSLCAGQNLYLQTGANETSNYLWNTGDTTAYLQINSAGEYSVTTTNTTGCVAIDTINIAIHGYAPIPGFDFSNTCFNDTTAFIDTSYTTDGSNIISWQWDFGNTETSTLQNPNILFADTGIYNVSLTVLTDSNCTNQINKQIEINPLPSAGFTHDALCQNYNINFINTSEIPKGSIDSVIWNINGNTLNSYNAIYNFPEYGNKQIKLKVFSDKNCKDSITKNIEIKPSPIAGFSVNNACVNKFVRFQNQTQTLSYNAILETLWNLDNFQTSVENPVYQFGMNDTSVNVQLYVKTVNGCTDTLRRQIHLYNNPVAKINNDSVCVLNPITLSESSSVENDSINYYLWEINGNFIESKNPNYTFTQTGSNTVTLFVNTIHNCSDTTQKNIEILDLPNADFTISPEYGIVNTTTHIVPETSNYSHIWNINNTTYTDSILNISFSDTGTTIIKHTAINNFGCKDSSSTEYLLVSPYADIAILNLSTKISGNKLTAEADIINFGNILIDSILISIHPEGYSTVSEKWTGRLIPKDYFHYRFNTIYNLTNTPEYICVSIKSLGIFPDPDITNNTTCNQSSDEFKVFPVYPNPASESINISFTIPEKDNVEIFIYNSKGKLVKKYPINNLDNKFNIVNINTSDLEKSVYTITLKYKKDTKSLKFVKN